MAKRQNDCNLRRERNLSHENAGDERKSDRGYGASRSTPVAHPSGSPIQLTKTVDSGQNKPGTGID